MRVFPTTIPFLLGPAILAGCTSTDYSLATTAEAGAGSTATAGALAGSAEAGTPGAAGAAGTGALGTAGAGGAAEAGVSGPCAVGDCPVVSGDLPSGYDGAQQIPVRQSACRTVLPLPEPEAAWTDAAHTKATVLNLTSACGELMCGFLVDESPVARVLIRPCDMNPTALASCICTSDFEFDVPSSAEVVEIYGQGNNISGNSVEPLGTLDGV